MDQSEKSTTPHIFLGSDHALNERRSWYVVVLASAMMIVELAAGLWLGSLALLADGLHMATHAGVMLLTAAAYALSRRYAEDPRFVFGTAKIGDLTGFVSAIGLGIVAGGVFYESAQRLLHPVAIDYGEAMLIAALGFAVNLASALLLRDHHPHDHDYDHRHEQQHHDNNFRAAYAHILADMGVSLIAVGALALGKYYGLAWMDAAAGILGSLVILSWAVTLARNAAAVLLDICPDRDLATAARRALEEDGSLVTDFHMWRVGPGHFGLIASVTTENPAAAADYKNRLQGFTAISHTTIEVFHAT